MNMRNDAYEENAQFICRVCGITYKTVPDIVSDIVYQTSET